METIHFLLTPNFAMMSAAAAIEPLRAANYIAGQSLYDVRFVSALGGFVQSSSGGGFDTKPMADMTGPVENAYVIAGANPFVLEIDAEAAFLRRLDRHGVRLGGISGGAVVLARAGLLGSRRFTVHWEHMEAMREEFPELIFEQRLFVLDRDRATCAGGVAPLDMMHALIRAKHGVELATEVSDWFIHTHVRMAEEDQRGIDTGDAMLHPHVVTAIRLMEDHIAEPLTLEQIAKLCGMSARQLQRHFQTDLGRSVVQHYTRVRLHKAEELLRQSRLSITEIAFAAGFTSQSNFARAFRHAYGQSPSDRRANQ
ncbi:MAG: GlxA family transcriptional regulator [Pseudomonadota bacterium]|nr:GlxA family transcriptional regulator [Pseudomonadota bacterium]